MVAGQHPFYVAIQYGSPLLEGLGKDGRSGGATNAGQGLELFQVTGKLASVLFNDLLRRLLEITGAGIVTKAGPMAEHVIHRGRGERFHVWKALHKSFEVGDNRIDLGLLQHDFRNPHAVWVPVMMPGQVVPAVFVVPGQKLLGETVLH